MRPIAALCHYIMGAHLSKDPPRSGHVVGEPALLGPHEPQDLGLGAELDRLRQQRVQRLRAAVRLLALRRPPAAAQGAINQLIDYSRERSVHQSVD